MARKLCNYLICFNKGNNKVYKADIVKNHRKIGISEDKNS